MALRWSDVDWSGFALTVSRAVSAGEETAPKSGKVRRVPLPDQAMIALERLSHRGDFTDPDELVICNVVTGRPLDGSALRRRYKAAQVIAGVHPMRWHDLRHTYGSLWPRAVRSWSRSSRRWATRTSAQPRYTSTPGRRPSWQPDSRGRSHPERSRPPPSETREAGRGPSSPPGRSATDGGQVEWVARPHADAAARRLAAGCPSHAP